MPVKHIPMFPLALLPLPGELVPLHIYEPRYKELVHDMEASDINIGIYFNHTLNKDKVGSLMRLESVLKRYASGESDVIVKCIDVLSMDRLYRNFRTKTYPGGDVRQWQVDMDVVPGRQLYELFLEYMALRNIKENYSFTNVYQIANELSLDLYDRYKFLLTPAEKLENFLSARLRFQIHLLQQEVRSKDVYHLN